MTGGGGGSSLCHVPAPTQEPIRIPANTTRKYHKGCGHGRKSKETK